MRRGLIIASAVLAIGVSACGSDGPAKPAHAPGTPQNPVVAPGVDAATVAAAKRKGHLNEASPNQSQGEQPWSEAVQAQSPCSLVSAADATTILKAAVRKPAVAPQGPTCVYRPRKGNAFVTLSVQNLTKAQLKQQTRTLKKIAVLGKTGYCARSVQSTLYLPVGGVRVLMVGGPCSTAKAFAVKALPQLGA